MRNRIKNSCIGLFFMWLLGSVLLAGIETVKMQIPMNMRVYEDEAVVVLSGNGNTIDPEALSLDFAGDIRITEQSGNVYHVDCQLFGVIPLKKMEVEVVKRQDVIPGGIPVGIYVQTEGVFVVGSGTIETTEGTVESPAKNRLKTGDYIISFQGEEIQNKQELLECLKNYRGSELVLGIRRNGEALEVCVEPIYTEEGCSIGVWVRDDTQGVGTLTYLTKDGKFGAVGHGISDADSELLMEVAGGRLYACEITGIKKGTKGNPGKLSGKINYKSENLYGRITGNLSGGVYGLANAHLKEQDFHEPIPIALKQEIKEGAAVILSSVGGVAKEYAVEITKVYYGEGDVNKGMEIVVTDPELLELTGGIVQGMSGSPIVQDGKLVGAVTHVLVNDPTRGYGIFIENMLEH